ncbi:hypothetical protein RQP46_007223 [Phenoliferia psychrophenolica]
MNTAQADVKSHYGVIIIGSGLSGLAANVQLKRKAGFTDVICYEAESDFGGTWFSNNYPGAACDIPISLYSYSFAQKYWGSHWPGQKDILDYMHDVADKFELKNIVCNTTVSNAHYSKGLWTVRIKNTITGIEAVKTANIVIMAVGGLREPLLPKFAVGNTDFEGRFFHSARWEHDIDYKGKNVVVVGNGCTAAQIIPGIIKDVGTLTQVARSRQTYIPPPPLPTWWFWFVLCRWIPGLIYLQRIGVYFAAEFFFLLSDVKRGVSRRAMILNSVLKNIRKSAPKEYQEVLAPDFPMGAKDDAVVSMKGRSIRTANGVEVPADIVVFSTGFNVGNYFSPLSVSSDESEVDLRTRMKGNNAMFYRGTCAHSFPNLFVIHGPNTGTGHSSVIFTSEAQITMMLKLVKPILTLLQTGVRLSPAPTVEVTDVAERNFFKDMRAEMKKKTWEIDGGACFYTNENGFCIVR